MRVFLEGTGFIEVPLNNFSGTYRRKAREILAERLWPKGFVYVQKKRRSALTRALDQMDYHNLTNRHIGSEVSVKIPRRDEFRNIIHEEEFDSRDMLMYRKNNTGERRGISIEVQKRMGVNDAHKFLYGSTAHFLVNNTEVHLDHNIILTRTIHKELCDYLNLERVIESSGFI